MRGLDPRIHLLETWIAGSSPAMTHQNHNALPMSETLDAARTWFQARCRSAYNAANDLQHSRTIVRMTQAGVSNARLRAHGKGTA